MIHVTLQRLFYRPGPGRMEQIQQGRTLEEIFHESGAQAITSCTQIECRIVATSRGAKSSLLRLRLVHQIDRMSQDSLSNCSVKEPEYTLLDILMGNWLRADQPWTLTSLWYCDESSESFRFVWVGSV